MCHILTEREPIHMPVILTGGSVIHMTVESVACEKQEPVVYESVSQLSNRSVHHRSEIVPGLPVAL